MHNIGMLLAIVAASSLLATPSVVAQAQSPKKVTAAPKMSQPSVEQSVVQSAPKVWEKEPSAFLGIQLGERFDVKACPVENIGTTMRVEVLDYQAMKNLNGVCYDPTDGVAKYSPAGNSPFYKLAHLPDLGIGYTATAKINDGVVERITLSLKQRSFDVLLEAFAERYGPPTSLEISQVRNNAGADFSARDVQWRGKKISIRMWERFDRVDESHVLVTDNAILDKETAAIRARRASEAQKF